MNRFSYLACAAVLMAVSGWAGDAPARDLFTVDVTTGGTTETFGSNSVEGVIDFVENGNYESINALYSDTAIATAAIDLRGVGATISYPTSGSDLVLVIPALGERRVFQGTTRADSETQLIDFLESNQDDLLSRILQELVRTSPVDPVAGNPNSLMSKMVSADFANGSSVGPDTAFKADPGNPDTGPALIGLPARLGRYTAGGFETDVLDLPLSYTFPIYRPGYAMTVDLPLTYVDTQGAKAFAASLGAGLRVPLAEGWSLTPALRVGATGSVDAGAAALLYSGSITSNFERAVDDLTFTLGNSIAVIRSAALSAGDYTADYDLTNVVFRNGIGLAGPTGFQAWNKAVTWEAAIVNTQYTGSDLFVENATDVSVSFGTVAERDGMLWDSVRIGVTYTFTDADYSGVRLNFGYRF